MKEVTLSLSILVCLFTVLSVTKEANSELCQDLLLNACAVSSVVRPQVDAVKSKCNPRYSGIDDAKKRLQEYSNQHILQSFKYLSLSTLFSSYAKNREGFEKFYKKLSDDTWNDAIEIIKHMTKRGLEVNFKLPAGSNKLLYDTNIKVDSSVNEIQSLSIALEMHKDLATYGHEIHAAVTKQNCHVDKVKSQLLNSKDCLHHDSEIESFVEKEFVHKHADTVRAISGHISDLSGLMNKNDAHKNDPQLEVYIFDQYLKKIV